MALTQVSLTCTSVFCDDLLLTALTALLLTMTGAGRSRCTGPEITTPTMYVTGSHGLGCFLAGLDGHTGNLLFNENNGKYVAKLPLCTVELFI